MRTYRFRDLGEHLTAAIIVARLTIAYKHTRRIYWFKIPPFIQIVNLPSQHPHKNAMLLFDDGYGEEAHPQHWPSTLGSTYLPENERSLDK